MLYILSSLKFILLLFNTKQQQLHIETSEGLWPGKSLDHKKSGLKD